MAEAEAALDEAKAGKNAGGADIPRIRNYEGARAVVKRPEASCLFVLGDTHRKYLAIRSPPCYSLSQTDVTSKAWMWPALCCLAVADQGRARRRL
jgi:hypothetical protein